ncbi:pyrroline-5-carboxylate reductase [Streptococcus sp. DD13]|uniref:pyrroline-5-carboxylate reductase n=1 Tax=Streptococcus sp. DD13 TaxID=1777881 RepID=UPI00079833B4|nr:pyrroline-5-carboxylate reductase [Streptococcus sp. DD13]KXT78552.1 Pyrroline-5-carboxylate reductase [Streptococcus sp. DD13]
MKIGFIGLGNMGGAVARSVAALGEHDLLLSHHNLVKAESLQKEIGGKITSNDHIVSQADVVFWGIKPQLLDQVLSSFVGKEKPGALWISMLAGVSLDQLGRYHAQQHWVRMMPNTPVAIGAGMTSYTCETTDVASLFEDLMKQSGRLMRLPEGLLDVATAIAGCGPAFVFEFIEALSLAGLEQGLRKEDATLLAVQTLSGASQLALNSDETPSQLRDQVTSPGGSTIAGVVEMKEAGFQSAIIRGVKKALQRTQELGNKE